MEKKMRRSVAPSMRADSSRLSGMERKKLFMMMQLYALTRPGRISARILSIRPIFWMSRKLGIIPAEKIMVKRTSVINTLPPRSLDLESG